MRASAGRAREEALGGQFVAQVGQRVGLAVAVGGEGGPAGGGEVGPVEPDGRSSASRRVISAARIGTSEREWPICCHRSARVGVARENPVMMWRACCFCVMTSRRSDRAVRGRVGHLGITSFGGGLG